MGGSSERGQKGDQVLHKKVSRRAFLGGSASALAALAITACAGEDTNSQVKNPDTPTSTPAPTETLPPTLVSTETATPAPKESPTPEPTKTPEREVACFVLPEKDCRQAERVLITRRTSEVLYIGIKELAPGTPVMARTNGTLDKAPEGAPFSGYFAGVRDAVGGTGTMYRGNLSFDNLFSKDVKQGEVIGTIGKGDIKSFGYELLITITRRTPEGPVVDEAALKELFPKAYEKPVVSFDGGQANPVPIISHSPTPPSPK
jgi:hypothetical protein